MPRPQRAFGLYDIPGSVESALAVLPVELVVPLNTRWFLQAVDCPVLTSSQVGGRRFRISILDPGDDVVFQREAHDTIPSDQVAFASWAPGIENVMFDGSQSVRTQAARRVLVSGWKLRLDDAAAVDVGVDQGRILPSVISTS